MKTHKSLFSFLLLLTLLVGCSGNKTSGSISSSHFFIRPSESSEEVSSSETTLSSSEEASSISSSLSQASIERITISDNFSSYTVGETYGHITNLNVVFYMSNNTELDVSNRLNYYDLRLSDAQGQVLDVNKPFKDVGTYYIEALYKRNHKIASNKLALKVLPGFTKLLNTKSEATKNFTYSDLENSLHQNLSYPSTGDINVLVLPIEISDFPFNTSLYGDNYMQVIDHAFNGAGVSDTGYWESLASYYTKSSGGELNFNFDIAPVYASGYRGIEVLEKHGFWGVEVLAQNALNDFILQNGPTSTQKYDNDKDGFIDGLWLVYSSPDYGNESYGAHPSADMYWAFRTYSTSNKANLMTPNLHSYAWASISFLERMNDAEKIDTHVFIHETGHLLGLPDYYSYDQSISSQGGLAMMDLNIGDHDAFSKMALGWSKPYVVTEDSIVKIKPNVTTGDAILLANDWNGTAFDEYILIDLVAPISLNKLDATTRYGGFPLYFDDAGIRMFHVDARLAEYKYLLKGEMNATSTGTYLVKEEGQDLYYLSSASVRALNSAGKLGRLSYDESLDYKERPSGYTIVNSNSPSRAAINELPYIQNRLLTIISADGMNTETFGTYATNDSLFKAGDSWTLMGRGLTISSSEEGTLNNGKNLRWIISVLAVNENEATIQFRKF